MKTVAEVLDDPIVTELVSYRQEDDVPAYVRTPDGALHEIAAVKWATIVAPGGTCEIVVIEAAGDPATEVFA